MVIHSLVNAEPKLLGCGAKESWASFEYLRVSRSTPLPYSLKRSGFLASLSKRAAKFVKSKPLTVREQLLLPIINRI